MPYLGTLGQQQRFAKSLDGIVSDPMDAEQQVNISGGELGELKNIAHRSSIQMCIVLVIFLLAPIHMLTWSFFGGPRFFSGSYHALTTTNQPQGELTGANQAALDYFAWLDLLREKYIDHLTDYIESYSILMKRLGECCCSFHPHLSDARLIGIRAVFSLWLGSACLC